MNPHSTPAPPDDGLEWLREIRRDISAQFGHDPKRYGDYLRQREAELGSRVVRTQKRLVSIVPKEKL